MRGTIRSFVISVSLVPLLVSELPPLLCLMFTQLGAVPIHVSLGLVVVAQAVPFGSSVLPVGIFPPISGADPAGNGTVNVRTSRGIIRRRGRRVTRTVRANAERKTSLCKRRASGK